MCPRTNIDTYALYIDIEPSLINTISAGLFRGYFNPTKFIIYFDPKTRYIKRNFNFYIDEYSVKLQLEEYMLLGDLIPQ